MSQNVVKKTKYPFWVCVFLGLVLMIFVFSGVDVARSIRSKSRVSTYPIRGTWCSTYESDSGKTFNRKLVFDVGCSVYFEDKSGLTVMSGRGVYITYVKDGRSILVISGAGQFAEELCGTFQYNATNTSLTLENVKTKDVLVFDKQA